MTEQWFEGRWRYEPHLNLFRWVPPGNYDTYVLFDEWPEGTIEVRADSIPKLVEQLEANGFLKPRLDDRLRAEDLKITHRLLDLLERARPVSASGGAE